MPRGLDKGYNLAILESLFARAGINQLPGSWLVDGSVKWVKLNADVLTTLNGEFVRVDTAFGGHVIGVYNNLRVVLPSGAYINLDGTENNVVAMGLGADGIRIGNPTGGNYLLVEADGTIQFVGDATVWEDLRFPVTAIDPAGTAAPPSRNTTTGLLEFSAKAVNIIAIQAQIPHAWKLGSAISPHIHWAPSNTDTGDVRWDLAYKIVPIGSVIPASWTNDTIWIAGSGTADEHMLSEFKDIDMSAVTGVSCMLLIKLSRNGSAAGDTFTGVAQLLEFDIHYQIDTIGSRSEYLK